MLLYAEFRTQLLPDVAASFGVCKLPKIKKKERATPVGFEPMRGDPIGLAGRRLNRSASVSFVAISIHPLTCNTYTQRTETRQLPAAFTLQMDN